MGMAGVRGATITNILFFYLISLQHGFQAETGEERTVEGSSYSSFCEMRTVMGSARDRVEAAVG